MLTIVHAQLLHEPPKMHGLNQTSWSIRALTPVFNKVYANTDSYEQLRYCLRKFGVGYKKSRRMLTSQDPKFREKINLQKVTDILLLAIATDIYRPQ